MPDTHKRFAGMKTAQIQEDYDLLLEMQKIAAQKVKISESKGVKLLVEELELRQQEIRTKYISINTLTHPNAVVATLSNFIGQETQIKAQLEDWKSIRSRKKRNDADLVICENILIERRKTEKQ